MGLPIRRMKKTIGDIDYLAVASEPSEIINYFINMPEVSKIISIKKDRAAVKLNNKIIADLFVVNGPSRFSIMALDRQYHAYRRIRKLAITKGIYLNGFSMYTKEGNKIPCYDEKDLYHQLGLEWIPPEFREKELDITN